MNTLANRGSFLESLIAASRSGVELDKVPTGAKIIRGPGGKSFAVPIKTLPDFVGGVCLPGPMLGHAIILDAKECKDKNRLKLQEHEMSMAQRQILIRWQRRMNAIAGVLAHSSYHRQLYWLRAEHLLPIQPSFQWSDPRLFAMGSSQNEVNWHRLIALYTPCD